MNKSKENISIEHNSDHYSEILIVEDETNIANQLSEHLRGQGYMVAVAPTVSMAREGLYEMTPDLVFLDMKLPDGLGLDLIPFLRRNHDCKIVAMSSDEQYMHKSLSGNERADIFMAKPLKIATVNRVLASIMDK